jgi:membrane protein insertase Oxa1/YidC/SpoIIIJ
MTLDVGLIAILITVLLAIIGAAFAYGALTNKVARNTADIKEIWGKYDEIDKKLDDLCLEVRSLSALLKKMT